MTRIPSWRSRRWRGSAAATLAGLALAMGPAHARTQPEAGSAGPSGYHAALLVPTADPIDRTELGLSVLTYPPSCVVEIAAPVRRTLAVGAFAGYSWIPNGLGGVVSASARLHLARPTGSRWGATTLAQVVLGAALVNAEGGGLSDVTALAGVVSSPIRPWRLHAGLALHTMPGGEHPGGRYDWRNPQCTSFASLERRLRWGSLYAEAVWAAPGADEGYDSVLLGQLGLRLRRGDVAVRASAGVGWSSAGAAAARSPFPVLPLVGVGFQF